jgi:hypothetical protein
MTRITRSTTIHLLIVGLFLICILFLALVYGRPVIQNDGITYYGLTLSLLKDHDFNLANQYAKYKELRVIPFPGTDKVASYYSCGFAFMYVPFLYVADLFTTLREWRPYAQNVRFPFSHAFGVFLGSIFYTFASVLLAYFLLIRHQKLPPLLSFCIPLFCLIGTPLLFYTLTVPSFAHASDTFLVSAAFVLAISKNPLEFHSIRIRNLLLGFVLALSLMLRNNNIVIIPVMVLGVLYLDPEKGLRSALRSCLEIFAGALPVLIVHAAFNFSQYGKLFATGYAVEVTRHAQVRLYRFFWIFFHPVPGIYPWSPLALLGSIGLIISAIRKNREAIVAFAIVLVVIISIRFAAIIFPGATFGQRLLTHLYIFWVFGVSELFIRHRKISSVLATVCVIWTFLLFNLYFVLTGCRESRIMSKEGGSTAVEWIQTSADCYRRSREANESTGPISFLNQNLRARPYPVLLHILFKD